MQKCQRRTACDVAACVVLEPAGEVQIDVTCSWTPLHGFHMLWSAPTLHKSVVDDATRQCGALGCARLATLEASFDASFVFQHGACRGSSLSFCATTGWGEGGTCPMPVLRSFAASARMRCLVCALDGMVLFEDKRTEG